MEHALPTQRIDFCRLERRPRWVTKLPGFLRLVVKALAQLLSLLYLVLFGLSRPDVILLQLPPAIPTMLVCRLAAARHHARLVFDWHNFAYTLMAINLGRSHPLVSDPGPGADP
jgi:beta-1,4-mannosyltransferase